MLRAAKGHVVRSAHRAFTLVEILIVVVILGILAAVVVPAFGSATEDSRVAAFVTSIESLDRAMRLYQGKYGVYPPDGGSGTLPVELEQYINPKDFNNGTPLGGIWDTEADTFQAPYLSLVGIDPNGETLDVALLTQADDLLDNGDLASGSFQELNGRYYWIVR